MSYEAVKSLLNKGGVSRPTLYRVVVPENRVGGRKVNDQLEMLCKVAAIPEVSVQTIMALGQDAQGVVRESPTNVIFGKPFSITVISDANYIVYKGLRRWFESVTTNSNPFGGGALAAQKSNYYEDITSAITIFKEENRNRTPFIVTLNNAYPINMGSINLDSSAQNQALEYNVDFYYETLTFTG